VNRRVVITGLGLVTPLAIGTKETWDALCAGKSAVAEITRFDASGLQTKIAAEVKDFHPEDFFSKKDARRFEPFVSYAMSATQLALEDAGLKIDDSNASRVGAITGCGLGGLSFMEETVNKVHKGNSRRVFR
jgi:3-oxoacyl-[acyl-carrier-protein] synthase II